MTHNAHAHHEPKKPSLILLILLVSFASVNAVLVSPALPMMGEFFHVSDNRVQSIVSLFLLAYAFGQLPFGPLANRYGRKPAFMMGIMLQIIGSFFCILASFNHHFAFMLAGRCLMALGSAVGLMMGFTLLNDFYPPEEARPMAAKMMMAFAIMPALSVATGGFLCDTFGWAACFYFLAGYGLLLGLTLHVKLDEPQFDRLKALHPTLILKGWLQAAGHKKLTKYAAIMGGCACIIYAFSAIGPFIGIKIIGLSESQYGLFSMLPSFGILIGSWLCQALNKRYEGDTVIRMGTLFSIGMALIMLVGFLVHVNVYNLFLCMFLINIGETLVISNASLIASSAIQDKANASAVMNFINMGIGFLGIYLIQSLPQTWVGLLPGSLLFFLTLMAVLSFWRRPLALPIQSQ